MVVEPIEFSGERNLTSHAGARPPRSSRFRKILASDMIIEGNSVTSHCSDPPNKHQGHVQDVQGDRPAGPMRLWTGSGVRKSQQAVLEKIPWALDGDVEAQQLKDGLYRTRSGSASPRQQRSKNVRLEYNADALGRAALVAHRAANRFEA